MLTPPQPSFTSSQDNTESLRGFDYQTEQRDTTQQNKTKQKTTKKKIHAANDVNNNQLMSAADDRNEATM